MSDENGIDEAAELEARLRWHGVARLSPDLAATGRMRAVVMAAADRAAGGRRTAPTAGIVDRPSVLALRPARGHRLRRFATALVAALLAVGVLGGAALGARPGGALYDLRLSFEELLLPADERARAAAQLSRLDARLDEALVALAGGDEEAVAAAIEAYEATIDDALRTAAGPRRAERLQNALTMHIEVLEGLLTRVPAPARDAIEQAIERSDTAVERIEKFGPTAPGTNNGQGAPGSARPERPAPGRGGNPPGLSP